MTATGAEVTAVAASCVALLTTLVAAVVVVDRKADKKTVEQQLAAAACSARLEEGKMAADIKKLEEETVTKEECRRLDGAVWGKVDAMTSGISVLSREMGETRQEMKTLLQVLTKKNGG